MDMKETYVFELSFKALAEAEVAPIAYEMIPRFPSITRDIALVVDQDKAAGDYCRTLSTKAGGKLIKRSASV